MHEAHSLLMHSLCTWMVYLLELVLAKDLLRYGHNTQIVQYKVGGTQTSYSFNKTQYFFEKQLRKYFFTHIKPEGMTQFGNFHILVENSVRDSVVHMLFWSSTPSSQIMKFIKKWPCLSTWLKKQVLVNPKICLTPSVFCILYQGLK